MLTGTLATDLLVMAGDSNGSDSWGLPSRFGLVAPANGSGPLKALISSRSGAFDVWNCQAKKLFARQHAERDQRAVPGAIAQRRLHTHAIDDYRPTLPLIG